MNDRKEAKLHNTKSCKIGKNRIAKIYPSIFVITLNMYKLIWLFKTQFFPDQYLKQANPARFYLRRHTQAKMMIKIENVDIIMY